MICSIAVRPIIDEPCWVAAVLCDGDTFVLVDFAKAVDALAKHFETFLALLRRGGWIACSEHGLQDFLLGLLLGVM